MAIDIAGLKAAAAGLAACCRTALTDANDRDAKPLLRLWREREFQQIGLMRHNLGVSGLLRRLRLFVTAAREEDGCQDDNGGKRPEAAAYARSGHVRPLAPRHRAVLSGAIQNPNLPVAVFRFRRSAMF